MEPENWHRGDYLVSTDSELLQVEAVNAALGSDIVWWAGNLPADALREALNKSLCFGLYHKSPAKASNGSTVFKSSLGKYIAEKIRPHFLLK
jgi:hypothetical protein